MRSYTYGFFVQGPGWRGLIELYLCLLILGEFFNCVLCLALEVGLENGINIVLVSRKFSYLFLGMRFFVELVGLFFDIWSYLDSDG